MSKLVLLIAIILSFSQSNILGQSLVTDSSEWIIREVYRSTRLSKTVYMEFKLKGNDTFHGRSYKILNHRSAYGDTIGYLRKSGERYYFMYNRSYFERRGSGYRRYIQPKDTAEFLLYDFGVSIGDTVPVRFDSFLWGGFGEYCRFKVIHFDSVMTISGMHRRIRLVAIDRRNSHGWEFDYLACYGDTMDWIETIGSPVSILYPLHGSNCTGLGESWVHTLTCLHKNGSLWYHPLGSCKPVSVHTPEPATQLKIYPNPAHGFLHIELSIPVALVEIYNSMGQPVVRIAQPSRRIAVSRLPKGIYFAKVLTADDVVLLKTIMFR